ncbi:MAG TPA: SDR family oxidoreductase, partial [Polyangiaceae bacterium]
MTVDIRGKWALVTGASRGVGLQIVRGLAERGCHLVLHSRELAHTEELQAELRSRGVTAVPVAAELSDERQVESMLNDTLRVADGIDILFNNAALMTPFRRSFLETPAEDFRLSFEINVIAPIRITHRLLPGMLRRGWGRIVQVTSGIQDQPELM